METRLIVDANKLILAVSRARLVDENDPTQIVIDIIRSLTEEIVVDNDSDT